jgi:hypothetical protein
MYNAEANVWRQDIFTYPGSSVAECDDVYLELFLTLISCSSRVSMYCVQYRRRRKVPYVYAIHDAGDE